MGYNFKYHKNTFYELTVHPPVWKSKNISGQMVLSRPPGPVLLINFSLNRRENVKHAIRDSASPNPKMLWERKNIEIEMYHGLKYNKTAGTWSLT